VPPPSPDDDVLGLLRLGGKPRRDIARAINWDEGDLEIRLHQLRERGLIQQAGESISALRWELTEHGHKEAERRQLRWQHR